MGGEISNHGLSDLEIKTLLPYTDEKDINRSLNQLHLFLHSKGMVTNQDLFGFRNLSSLLSLIAHPEAKTSLFDELKQKGLLVAYENQEWPKIHKSILHLYKEGLSKLKNTLDSFYSSAQNES